jgi:hypothetical protein
MPEMPEEERRMLNDECSNASPWVLGIHHSWHSSFLAFIILGIRHSWHSSFLAFVILGIHHSWHSSFLAFIILGIRHQPAGPFPAGQI